MKLNYCVRFKHYRARLAKKKAKRKIDQMMMDDYYRGYENYIQPKQFTEDSEKLHGMHSILKKNIKTRIWTSGMIFAKDFEWNFRQFAKADRLLKLVKAKKSTTPMFECLTILEDMNTNLADIEGWQVFCCLSSCLEAH